MSSSRVDEPNTLPPFLFEFSCCLRFESLSRARMSSLFVVSCCSRCPLGWSSDGLVALPLCVMAHCLLSSLCLMATKVFGPVWGFFPLHHVACVVGVLAAPSLRYSSAYDPCPLFGTPLRHFRIPSGAFVHFSLSVLCCLLAPLFSFLLCVLVCSLSIFTKAIALFNGSVVSQR